MCVPAHDDRDFEFAKKFGLPIIQVIAQDGKEIENMTEAYTDAVGTMINSGEWNGQESSVLKKEAPHMIEERGIGRATVNFKLRDWVFSRQRYWGEPNPDRTLSEMWKCTGAGRRTSTPSAGSRILRTYRNGRIPACSN